MTDTSRQADLGMTDKFFVSYNKVDGVSLIDDIPKGTVIILLNIDALEHSETVERGNTVYIKVDLNDYFILLSESISTLQWKRY